MVIPSNQKEQLLDKTGVCSKKFYLSRTYILTSINEIDSCHKQEVLDDFQWIDGMPVALGFEFTEIDVLVTAHREDDGLNTKKIKKYYRTAEKS